MYSSSVAQLSILQRETEPDERTAAASRELLALVDRAATKEGDTDVAFPGLRFHRASKPSVCRKWHSMGPSFTVVAQGRKFSTYRGVKLSYDPSRYLVVTGEAEFEGTVTEASPERPFLAVCYLIPPDVVAKTLLAVADANVEPAIEPVPAFVSALDAPIAESLVRLLRSIDDPLERAVVGPLAIEELVFRLLRSDAAAAVRSAVGRDREADKIRAAMLFLRANLERPISVEDVARHVAMSPSHFAHRFRAVARVSPMRYLKQQRLHRARELMVGSGARIQEAAVRAGYESASHFSRDFKALFGCAPGEYSRRLRDA
ncbi:MAG: Transcriptional regulator, AraC family [Labilithrix sp.]|nr:Transcriptional regulator, AraC family [Labilithrix sp.]